MKRLFVIAMTAAWCGVLAYSAAAAPVAPLPGAKTAAELKVKKYQVTGPILELTDAKIIVQKGDEKWEIARDASTTVTGELKVGAKVTIEYKMIATDIEVKPAKAAEAKPAKGGGGSL